MTDAGQANNGQGLLTIPEEDAPIPENAAVILSSLHGRQRRLERNTSKSELAEALLYGQRSRGFPCPRTGKGRWKFSYRGITYVTDESCKEEITSYINPCWGINIEKFKITAEVQKEHDEAIRMSLDYSSWNSSTVAIIDQSGSMRKTDASHGTTRSDLAWLCLAVDYVGKRVRSGEATCQDYFSLIILSEAGTILLRDQPVDWILFNRLIDFLRNRQPLGDDNYLPALGKAEKMLSRNKYGNCALQLLFLTDGAPSDKTPAGYHDGTVGYHKYSTMMKISSIASRFGPRLTLGGFAIGKGNYGVLEEMIKTAKEYNCKTIYMRASLNVENLSSAFDSMSTLMSSTKITMTGVGSNHRRTICDLIREPTSAIDVYVKDEPEWSVSLNIRHNYSNIQKLIFSKRLYQWQYQHRAFNHPLARGIAIRRHIFAEGRERAVRRVREVDANGNFVGDALVGKETLYIEDIENISDVKEFHKTFCKLQNLAQRFTISFNKKLLALPGVDRNKTPTIDFLQCYVLLYNDHNGEQKSILMEKMINHKKYRKWNTNDGQVAEKSYHQIDVDQDEINKDTEFEGILPYEDCRFDVEDIPQVYSHFTYLCSERKFLVCDLQGVLDDSRRPPVFEMTDPAIHYKEKTNRRDYGRTDLGEEGISEFFKTHKCTSLCQMIMHRWIKTPLEGDIVCYENPNNNLQKIRR